MCYWLLLSRHTVYPTVFALLCFVVVVHWLIFPYPSGLLHWHSGNLTIAPVPAKQPWWIWINTSCEFIMNDCITTTKQSTTKPCAYFLGYTVARNALRCSDDIHNSSLRNTICRNSNHSETGRVNSFKPQHRTHMTAVKQGIATAELPVGNRDLNI